MALPPGGSSAPRQCRRPGAFETAAVTGGNSGYAETSGAGTPAAATRRPATRRSRRSGIPVRPPATWTSCPTALSGTRASLRAVGRLDSLNQKADGTGYAAAAAQDTTAV
jgi:hypothetical protein